ncbi:integrator complex subunit 14 isoform X2 [Lycorma delicatula]|uniref:integrator complex subunit 14 isoform X2 n=1 Tax=Lycorma delicatula TaxID=130591 RepID=UPI003F519768
MPTVVVLDVSLSMARPITSPDGETMTRLQLAVQGINNLLDYFSLYSKLEFVALVTFSSIYEVISPFTRDFDLLKSKISQLEEQDKSCLEPVLQYINSLVLGEWGSATPCQPYTKVSDFVCETYSLSGVLEICGFIELVHVGSPAAVSRHLVLPHPGAQPPPQPAIKMEIDSDDETHDEGKTPSFCVLLHGSLKVENMAAMCQVGKNWYGVLYSWADSKKKSNLMLTLLEPSVNSVSWLGNFNYLGVPEDPEHPNPEEAFPVRPAEKRSYSQNCVVWIRQAGLQSDIQKILRHARKLPDKTQHFYKELNRVRRAAISLGFMSLLDGLAAILERECTLLPGGAHPDCALQLTHAAGVLRKPYSRDPKYNVLPMRTKFTDGD